MMIDLEEINYNSADKSASSAKRTRAVMRNIKNVRRNDIPKWKRQLKAINYWRKKRNDQ